MSKLARPLHFVFKIASRTKTIDFYTRILGMKILRHEEFEEGCNAACNGPYDNKWSKTMIGYGVEDDHFVIELTYNYGVRDYKLGNDFNYIKLNFSRPAFESVKTLAVAENHLQIAGDASSSFDLIDPNGYKFQVNLDETLTDRSLVGVSLFVTDLQRSISYWCDTLYASLVPNNDESSSISLQFGADETARKKFTLNLVKSMTAIDHATSYGRIAFSCPTSELADIQARMDQTNNKILTRLIHLDTPGKATVSVVILADPDGHEICFVGDEGFRELSKFDEQAQKLLDDAVSVDKSDEWHSKKAAAAARQQNSSTKNQ